MLAGGWERYTITLPDYISNRKVGKRHVTLSRKVDWAKMNTLERSSTIKQKIKRLSDRRSRQDGLSGASNHADQLKGTAFTSNGEYKTGERKHQ